MKYKIIFLLLACVLNLKANNLCSANTQYADILNAINAQSSGNLQQAWQIYECLYNKTNDLEYLKESIMIQAMQNNPIKTLQSIESYLQDGGKNDIEIQKIKLNCYLKLNLNNKALAMAKELESSENSPFIQDVLGLLNLKNNNYKQALKHFQNAYNQTKHQAYLQKVIITLHMLDRQKQAKKLLDSHILSYGCFGELCQYALNVYSNNKDVEKLEIVLISKFRFNASESNALELFNFYIQQKQLEKAANLANSLPQYPQILLNFYTIQNDYANASRQSELIYTANKNPYYLALSQIYKFEALDSKDLGSIKDISKQMQNAINLMQKDKNSYSDEIWGVFLNFVGYVMIDYDIDIKNGIKYVKQALSNAPNDIAYLDSLAWGYLKLKDCANAKSTFAQIPQEKIDSEDTIKIHFQELNNTCKK